MGIKKGYKQTEVGVIPEDWEVKNIGQVVSMSVGRDVNEASFSSIQDAAFQYPVYSNTVSNRGLYGYYSFAEYYGESLTVVGRGVGLGTAFRRSGGYGAIGRLLVLHPNTNADAGYLTEYINQRIQIFTESGGIPQLTGQSLSRYKVPVPPTKCEQEAIAETLSDADALIESLEQLLVKKRHVKKGAMQELLSPKPSDEVRLLREVSSLKGRIGWQGLKQTEFTSNDNEPFLITGMNFKDGAIRWNEVYHISEARYDMAPEIQLRPDDVLMTKDGTIGKVLYIDAIPYPGKASLNSHLLLFRSLKNSYCAKYLYYQLGSRRFQDYIEQSKSGTTFFGLSQAAVGEYPLLLPPMIDQIRVAVTLSDMDTEIAALETKLIKARQLKTGMMQELLTGRIRLI